MPTGVAICPVATNQVGGEVQFELRLLSKTRLFIPEDSKNVRKKTILIVKYEKLHKPLIYIGKI